MNSYPYWGVRPQTFFWEKLNMNQDLEKQLKDLQLECDLVEGSTPKIRKLNRLHGLIGTGVGLGACYTMFQSEFPMDLALYLVGVPILIGGAGELFTGKRHYVLCKMTGLNPRYFIKKLKDEYNIKE